MTATAEHRTLCVSRFTWLNEDTGQMELVGLPCDCAKVADWALVPVPFIEQLQGRRLCTGCVATVQHGKMVHQLACKVAHLHRPPGWPGANPLVP